MNKTELKQKMLKMALPLMTHYQTDLIYCFEGIDRIDTQDIPCLLSWQVSKAGTSLFGLDTAESVDLAATRLEFNNWEAVITYTPQKEWSIEELTAIENMEEVQDKWEEYRKRNKLIFKKA